MAQGNTSSSICLRLGGRDAADQLHQNNSMIKKNDLMGGGRALELAATVESLAKPYRLPTGLEAQLTAMQTSLKPWMDAAKQLENIDPHRRGIRAAMEKNGAWGKFVNDFARVNIAGALAKFQGDTGSSRAIKQFSGIDVAHEAGNEELAQYPIFLEFLEARNRDHAVTAASADLRSSYAKSFAGLFGGLRGSLGNTTVQALLDSLGEPLDTEKLLEETQLLVVKGVGTDITHLAQNAVDGISKAQTTQEAVDQIVLAIQATNEPQYRWVLVAIFFPLLLWFSSPFWNSYVDFHVKKNLEGTSTQTVNKEIKGAAREAVGDLRLLRDYRFVTAQSLAVRAEPKARGQILGQLRLGQTVHVQGKERDFTLVTWRSEDGNAQLQGWVFSRHLKRFQ